MRLGEREILYTYTCAENPVGHWHAKRVLRAAIGTTSVGTGRCLSLPAALIWLLTGYEGTGARVG